jgi:hypothetical protein
MLLLLLLLLLVMTMLLLLLLLLLLVMTMLTVAFRSRLLQPSCAQKQDWVTLTKTVPLAVGADLARRIIPT